MKTLPSATQSLVICAMIIRSTFSLASGEIPDTRIENPHIGILKHEFGRAIAFDGTTMAVGANEGVRTYVSDGQGHWNLQSEITTTDYHYSFGDVVAISGNVLIIKTNNREDNVYIFIREGSNWVQWDKFIAKDIPEIDYFYDEISISGDRFVIGAVTATGEECVCVFSQEGSTWSFDQAITATDADPDDGFGRRLSLSGETLVVGASGDDDIQSNSGAVYVFTLSGSNWVQSAKILPSGTTRAFGRFVSISENRVAIVAGSWQSGEIFIFNYANSVWQKEQVLQDICIDSLCLSGDSLIIGQSSSNKATVYIRSESNWSQQAILQQSNDVGNNYSEFGQSVIISGDTAFIGAPQKGFGYYKEIGAAYVFTRSESIWKETVRLDSDGAKKDQFGYSVEISGDIAVIAALGDRDGHNVYPVQVDEYTELYEGFGSVYVYTHNGSEWIPQQRLIGQEGYYYGCGGFGSSVSISEDTILVGAWPDDQHWQDGAAYVFKRNAGTWIQQGILDGGISNDFFGEEVSLSGDTALIGAPGDGEKGRNSGAAYIYTRVNDAWPWNKYQKLTAFDASENDTFGCAVAVSGDIAVIGASGDDSRATNAGAAYVYKRSGETWDFVLKLTAPDAEESGYFGRCASLEGDILTVGGAKNTWIFTRNGIGWISQKEIFGTGFGSGVSVSGDTVAVKKDYSIEVYKGSGSRWGLQTILGPYPADNFYNISFAIDTGRVIAGFPFLNEPEEDSGVAYIYDLSQETNSQRWIQYR